MFSKKFEKVFVIAGNPFKNLKNKEIMNSTKMNIFQPKNKSKEFVPNLKM
jgi:hypothetical protein